MVGTVYNFAFQEVYQAVVHHYRPLKSQPPSLARKYQVSKVSLEVQHCNKLEESINSIIFSGVVKVIRRGKMRQMGLLLLDGLFEMNPAIGI